MSIYAKIQSVMNEVQYLEKDGKIDPNEGKSYKVITEEKVTSSVRAAMAKNGLVMFPEAIEEDTLNEAVEYEYKGKPKKKTNRFCRVKVTYRMVDTETGESITIQSCGSGADTQDKAVGKAMTYAYKYALLRTFAIPTGEDPDLISSDDYNAKLTGEEKPEPPKEVKNRVPTKDEFESLITECMTFVDGDIELVERYCNHNFGTTDATELTLEQLTKMRNELKAWRKRKDEKAASGK